MSGSLLLGLAINIKILPIVILPYLVYRRKIRASLAVIAISIGYLLLPSMFIGYDFNLFLLAEWWELINPTNNEFLIEVGKGKQSLVSMLPVFLTETSGDLALKRNFLSLTPDIAIAITNGVRLGLILLTLYFLKSPFTKAIDKLSEVRALAYICLMVPLCFPHQHKYAFIFLLPIVMYLVYYCLVMWTYRRSLKFKIYLGLFCLNAIGLTPFIGSDIIGRYYYDLLHHFRFLGIHAIALVAFAVIAKPKDIRNVTFPQKYTRT